MQVSGQTWPAHQRSRVIRHNQAASVQAGLNRGNGMIRTLIAEQTSLVRAGLVALLSGTGDIDVIAELQRGDQVVSASLAFQPDVAVLDAALFGADGFAAARALHAELPSCRSLIMSERRDPASLRCAVAAHATGFVVRRCA
jgi:two-component system response regulator DesR